MKDETQPLSYREQLALIRSGDLPKTTGANPKKAMKRVSDKRAAEIEAQKVTGKPPSKLALDKWFEDIRLKHWGEGQFCTCMECGVGIPVNYSRHATAHLLPKKLFKSISTHPLNYLILGAGCGCHALTDRVDKFTRMKIWPEAARRIKEMIPLLPFDELKYLSGQLMTAIENT